MQCPDWQLNPARNCAMDGSGDTSSIFIHVNVLNIRHPHNQTLTHRLQFLVLCCSYSVCYVQTILINQSFFNNMSPFFNILGSQSMIGGTGMLNVGKLNIESSSANHCGNPRQTQKATCWNHHQGSLQLEISSYSPDTWRAPPSPPSPPCKTQGVLEGESMPQPDWKSRRLKDWNVILINVCQWCIGDVQTHTTLTAFAKRILINK